MSDLLNKRLNIASQAVSAATKLVDALNELKELKTEYESIASPFLDSDFVPALGSSLVQNELKHLDAYTVGALLSNVTPAISVVVLDGVLNQNVLMKVRK